MSIATKDIIVNDSVYDELERLKAKYEVETFNDVIRNVLDIDASSGVHAELERLKAKYEVETFNEVLHRVLDVESDENEDPLNLVSIEHSNPFHDDSDHLHPHHDED